MHTKASVFSIGEPPIWKVTGARMAETDRGAWRYSCTVRDTVTAKPSNREEL